MKTPQLITRGPLSHHASLMTCPQLSRTDSPALNLRVSYLPKILPPSPPGEHTALGSTEVCVLHVGDPVLVVCVCGKVQTIGRRVRLRSVMACENDSRVHSGYYLTIVPKFSIEWGESYRVFFTHAWHWHVLVPASEYSPGSVRHDSSPYPCITPRGPHKHASYVTLDRFCCTTKPSGLRYPDF